MASSDRACGLGLRAICDPRRPCSLSKCPGPRVIPPVVTAAERDRAAEVEAAEDRAEQAAFDSMRERS